MDQCSMLTMPIIQERLQLRQLAPARDLSPFIQHYWMSAWDFREPFLVENLPHPCVHLSIEPGQARIVGVVRGKFSYLLEGTGSVFGVRFRPGGFYPFWKAPIARLTDGSIGLEDLFGVEESQALARAVRAQTEVTAMVAIMENFLRERLPGPDGHIELVDQIVEHIVSERAITRVDDLVQRFNLNKRTLQRLFSRYVGVSPRWVIKRSRLHEAAGRLAEGAAIDWPRLALELGYFDQSHFIRDFKAIVGHAPASYTRHLAFNLCTC